jgi:UDP-GlcNAc:undecaprenyl-phosphate GlcNAc-1-phosphate transferase
MSYIFPFLLSLIFSIILTLIVKKIAIYYKVVDKPDDKIGGRKIHTHPIPLLGGLAIFASYFLILFLFSDKFLAGNLRYTHLIGFFIGGLVIMIGGALDDKYNLRPYQQIIFPILAIVAVILGGVEISQITNPFGSHFDLIKISYLSPILIFIWLMGLMYTTKLLDGVDGLVSGVSGIGAIIIFLFTLTTRYYQPDIAFASIALVGAIAGFLIFNWNPAKIFLGEGGSLLLGYILGVLAIISGGKIAIALLVMGVPVLDVAWTILRRLLKGQNPFRFADRKHLHHRLLDLGLGQKKTVLVFYSFSLIFGLSGLFLQSKGKFLALLLLLFIMLLIVIAFWCLDKKKEKEVNEQAEHDLKEVVKPRLLLHICCAPCATYLSVNRLAPFYDLTWYFYNSNLCDKEEYNKRLAAVQEMANKFNFKLLVEPYDHQEWLKKIKGRENDLERGPRCKICYSDRILKTIKLASEKKFDFFSTSLLVSPYKDSEAIKNISRSFALEYKVKFLEDDFQSDNAYQKSQTLAKELGIYRQKFCGCEYSKTK